MTNFLKPVFDPLFLWKSLCSFARVLFEILALAMTTPKFFSS
jgi:hypothetical protein